MTSYAIPLYMLWIFIFYAVGLKLLVVWWIIKFFKRYNTDLLLLIDKNDRWQLINKNFYGKTEIKHNAKAYFLVENCGLLNKKGKSLYVFAENKPQPLKLEYNKSKWLDSQSLMAIINNKLVQQIVKPIETLKDTLMMLGAIGGLVAGVASVVVLLKILEVF